MVSQAAGKRKVFWEQQGNTMIHVYKTLEDEQQEAGYVQVNQTTLVLLSFPFVLHWESKYKSKCEFWESI